VYAGDLLGDRISSPCDHIRRHLLGTIEQTVKDSWARLIGKVRAQANRAFTLGRCLATRMGHVNTFFLSKIWYTAQNLPAPNKYTQQLTTAIRWYIWRGTFFRVSVSTLRRPKPNGRMGDAGYWVEVYGASPIPYVPARPTERNGDWRMVTDLEPTGRQANPPHATKFPTKLAYRYVYAVNMAYITPSEQDKASRCFRRRIYASLSSKALERKGARDVRIMKQHPNTTWSKVWGNLNAILSSDELKAAWFMVMYDLIPTNDRLDKTQRSTTNNWEHCSRVDTLIHRLSECSEGAGIWRWTRSRTAINLRMDHNLPEWTVLPSFQFWPPQRHRALLWILARMMYYSTQHWHRVSTIDYADFMNGKHIDKLTGAKGLGITWRYYNLRYTSSGETVFTLAAG